MIVGRRVGNEDAGLETGAVLGEAKIDLLLHLGGVISMILLTL